MPPPSLVAPEVPALPALPVVPVDPVAPEAPVLPVVPVAEAPDAPVPPALPVALPVAPVPPVEPVAPELPVPDPELPVPDPELLVPEPDPPEAPDVEPLEPELLPVEPPPSPESLHAAMGARTSSARGRIRKIPVMIAPCSDEVVSLFAQFACANLPARVPPRGQVTTSFTSQTAAGPRRRRRRVYAENSSHRIWRPRPRVTGDSAERGLSQQRVSGAARTEGIPPLWGFAARIRHAFTKSALDERMRRIFDNAWAVLQRDSTARSWTIWGEHRR